VSKGKFVAEQLNRRALLGAGLAVGAGVAGLAAADPAAADTAPTAGSTTSLSSTVLDAVVIGAGLAGMTAARNLAAAGKRILVLEARDRVGGRTYDVPVTGSSIPVEAGAEFTGPTQTHLQSLATALGVHTFTGYNTGDGIYYADGTVIRFSGALPPMDAGSLQALYTAFGTLDSLAATVPVDAPWTAPRAEEFDGQTFASWITANVSDATAQAILFLVANGALSAEARDMSLLWFLYYVAASGDENNVGTVERLTGTVGGARDSRFVGGPQQITLKIAQSLGSRVVLGAPVRSISQANGVATVVTDCGTVRAKAVVVALPPTLAARIEYQPPLPATRDQLTQRFPLSSIGKAILIYDTPFWRASGLNGQASSTTGTVHSTFDNSPPDGSYGALLGFIDGDAMRSIEGLSDATIKQRVLADMVNYFGSAAGSPKQFYLERWDDQEFTRGGAPAFMAPGVLTRFGSAVRPASGLIHWAGAETSTFWNGHMEGAVRSGERAASEILGS
jgi:monoamine oxidase